MLTGSRPEFAIACVVAALLGSLTSCGTGDPTAEVSGDAHAVSDAPTADGLATDGLATDGLATDGLATGGWDGTGSGADSDDALDGGDDSDGGVTDTATRLICPGSPGCPCTTSGECDDGDLCTVDGPCDGGACQGKQPASCDDSVACTDDTCADDTGCHHAVRQGPCQDGDPCTVGDACKSGVCAGGEPAACDDHNPCTDDSCTPGIGCTFTHNTATCVDENACAEAGVCDFASCYPGKLKPCSDGNTCTYSVCDPVTGCAHVALPSEVTCTGGQTVDNRCYRAFSAPKPISWLQARASCVSWGGVLATVHSTQANAAARSQATGACGVKSDAWIGLNDRTREGVWRWSDGSATDYQNWAKFEPNNAGNEDVAALRPDGLWNDRSDGDKTVMSCWVCSRRLPQACAFGAPACTTGALCAAGSCDGAAATTDTCDDVNACTADSCSKGGCGHTPLPDDATCTGGTCAAGVCEASEAPPSSLPTGGLPASCLGILQADPAAMSGVRWLQPTGLPAPVSAHCDQRDGGGWTLVLKTGGKNSAFAFAGKSWSAKPIKTVANPGPDAGEAVLPTYWTVPVQQVRVIMARKKARRSIVLNAKGSSLYALIQTKKPTATTAGLGAWKQLLIDASLQKSCHSEGINTAASNGSGRVRIGIIGNQENNCATPDSWLGVGGVDSPCGGKKGVFSGNIACYGADKGYRNSPAATWVYVR